MKIPRNESCPCLSGKKYKKCCDLQEKSVLNQPVLNMLMQQGEAVKQIDKYVEIPDFDQKCTWVIEQVKLGNIVQVQDEIKLLFQAYPDNEGVYLLQGLCYISAEQYKEAIDSLQQAVRIYPLYSEAYYELGHAYFLQEDIVNAVASLKKVLAIERLDPQNDDLQVAAQEMLTSMEKSAKEACNLNLDGFIKYVSLVERAETCFNTGKYKKSAMLFEEALEMAPNMTDLYEPLAATYTRMGEEELARQTITRLVMIDSNYLEKFLDQNLAKEDQKEGNQDDLPDMQIAPDLELEL